MSCLKTFWRVHPTPILFALIALLATDVAAQTPPTFSVSVTERSELIEEVGTTRRVDRAEIEARNARTLDEALKLVPGIYTSARAATGRLASMSAGFDRGTCCCS